MPSTGFNDSLSSPKVSVAARIAAKYLDGGGGVDLTEEIRSIG